jgi:acetate kinase
VVTDELLTTLTRLVHFAPNHLPGEIALIEAARRRFPDVHQVVCFDTAFHSTLPDVARRLPIPGVYDEQGIRRYGFHGLSYTFLLQQLRRRGGPAQANGNVVLMHLGNGSSLAAVQEGRSIDTSMGFTPIGGVVMGTRSGDLDPGVATYIARTTGADADRVERVLSQESGLAGISGGVHDMRELLAREASDDACRLAVAIYCYEIKKQIGAYAAALGGLDALVFSGGIGEHAAAIRARICRGLTFLGVDLDHRLNDADAPLVSTSGSRVAIHVIPTDEELVIAQAACQAIDGHP